MAKSDKLPVNFSSVARYLHSALLGKGVDGVPVHKIPNVGGAVPLNSDILAHYFTPPDKRAPTKREFFESLQTGELSKMGFFMLSDNFSETFIVAPQTISPPVDDLPVDMDKFSRFLRLLFSKRFVFAEEDEKDLIYVDPDTHNTFVRVNDALIRKFRVERGHRPPTLEEVGELLFGEMADKYDIVDLPAPHNCLALRPLPRTYN